MPKSALLVVALMLAWQAPVLASDAWHSPGRGTAERRQVLEALRDHMRRFHDLPLEFVVREMCLSDARGWLSVDPRSPDGRSRYERLSASLARVGGHWSVDVLACGEDDCPPGTDAEALRAQVGPQCQAPGWR